MFSPMPVPSEPQLADHLSRMAKLPNSSTSFAKPVPRSLLRPSSKTFSTVALSASKDNNRHILLVTHYYSEHCGGVEIAAEQIANGLARRGWQITWAASGLSRTIGVQSDIISQGAVTRMPMATCNIIEDLLGIPYPIWGPLSCLKILLLIRSVDIVHLHDCLTLGNVFAYLCARLYRKPVVVTQHVGAVPHSDRLLRLIHGAVNAVFGRLVLGGSTQTAFITAKVYDFFSGFVRFRRKPKLIANGVDTDLFRPVSERQRQLLRVKLHWSLEKHVFLFAGRFVAKKNLAILKRLALRFPAVDWVFVGWGPDSPANWKLANVHCVGRVPHEDMPIYYQAADLLLLLSVGEGFPLVVQEGMACGLPIIAGAETVEGMPAIEQAVFTTDLDWPSLVSLVENLISDPRRRRALRKAALAYAKTNWDWKVSVDRYVDEFQKLIEL